MILLRRLFLLALFVFHFSFFFQANASEPVIVGKILITGNKVTHESIILRELEFTRGDTLPSGQVFALVEQSRINLLNLPLFHFVTISACENEGNKTTDFTINLTERWYTWVWPVFEIADRNFNAWLENGDLSRVSYGLFLQQENFRGRLEKLHFKIKLGYQQEITLLYEIPYLNRKKTFGAGLLVSLGRQRETGYITEEDKLIYARADDFLQHAADIAAFVRWRPDIHFSHTFQLRYNTRLVSDSLLLLNPAYSNEGNQEPRFYEISYLLKADFRDQRAYPLNGWYIESQFARTSLFSGDVYSYLSAKLVLRAYHQFNRNWHLAGSLTGRLISDVELPYYQSQALGYRRDYVRGYEYDVIDGRNFWLLKINPKFAVIKPSIIKLKWPRSGKFNTIPWSVYLSAFADAGKVFPSENSESNQLPGALLKGFGLGLDFVTYYDKVFRAEFSVNGSGETGFFLHFMAAI
ncbi:MAG: BamA/TamA family outer membrane protein [Lentimicrobium sp.]|nr:BamA/TamA family outer membrane protein [Lentimicrobium sp.]